MRTVCAMDSVVHTYNIIPAAGTQGHRHMHGNGTIATTEAPNQSTIFSFMTGPPVPGYLNYVRFLFDLSRHEAGLWTAHGLTVLMGSRMVSFAFIGCLLFMAFRANVRKKLVPQCSLVAWRKCEICISFRFFTPYRYLLLFLHDTYRF